MPPLLGGELEGMRFYDALARRLERRSEQATGAWEEVWVYACVDRYAKGRALARYDRLMRRCFALREAMARHLMARRAARLGEEVAA